MKLLLRQLTLAAFSLGLSLTPLLYFAPLVSAADLISRSVTIGDSLAGTTTSHNYSFTIPTAGTIGSIEFEYCENDPFIGQPCIAPLGLDVSSASIDDQSGETGFSIHPSTTANRLVITRIPSANLAFQGASYDIGNVINPSDETSVYVRISTFATDDASGSRTDSGAVVFSTNLRLQVEGFVPPYLTFCTGITVALDCTTANGDFIQLGEISKTSANFATSQYSGATNDPGGFSTTLSGTTMTSGNNIILALTTGGASKPGTSQFGVNLRDNSSPNVGQNRTGSGTSVALAGYNTVNIFSFGNQVISNSTLPTDFNRFTVSYLVNVSPNQPAGVYSATLNYIATAAF